MSHNRLRISTGFLVGVLVILFQGTFSSLAQETNFSDTTKPDLVSVILNPVEVDVSKEGAVLLATIIASDDLNVVNQATAYLDPFYGANPQSSTNTQLAVKKVNGKIETTLQLKFIFKKGTPVGEYRLRITLYDAADNRNVAYLLDSPQNRVKVVNNNPSTTTDVSEFDYAKRLSDYAVQVKDLSAEITTLKSQLTRYSTELASARVERDGATSDKASLQKEIASVTKERESLQQSVASLNETVKSLSQEFESVKKRLKTICKLKPKPKGC